MIRLSVSELRAGMKTARSVPKPEAPATVLLPRGTRLNDRAIRLLRRVGFRSLWVEWAGSEPLDTLLAEETLQQSRALAQRLHEAIARAQSAGGLDGDLLLACRDEVMQYHDRAVSRLPGRYLLLDHLATGWGPSAFHGVRVCTHALRILLQAPHLVLRAVGGGRDTTLRGTEAAPLGLGALLHDHGKTLLPEELFTKEPWELSLRDRKEMESHTHKGHDLLRPHVGALVACVARTHHLFEDGAGYPLDIRLGEEGDPKSGGRAARNAAAIVSLCNVFDTLVGRQDYLSIEAMEEICCARRAQFLPSVLEAFRAVTPPFDPGMWVTLGSGHGGVVSACPPEAPFRPDILMLADTAGEPLPPSQRVVLSLRQYGNARIRSVAGRIVDHLLPRDPAEGWGETE